MIRPQPENDGAIPWSQDLKTDADALVAAVRVLYNRATQDDLTDPATWELIREWCETIAVEVDSIDRTAARWQRRRQALNLVDHDVHESEGGAI